MSTQESEPSITKNRTRSKGRAKVDKSMNYLRLSMNQRCSLNTKGTVMEIRNEFPQLEGPDSPTLKAEDDIMLMKRNRRKRT